MADKLPIEFDVPGESVFVSYDWNQFGTNTGMKLFYGVSNQSAYVLTENQIYSQAIESSASITANQAATKMFDLDFDLTTFKVPQTVLGTAIINCCMAENSVGNKITYYVIAKIRKWNGAVETEIANGQSISSNGKRILNISVPITTEAHFAIGETLRVTIEVWIAYTGNPSTYQYALGFDPMNRDGTYIIPSTDPAPFTTTQLKIWMPFKLQP
jgi:hypothetical protein